MQHYPMVVDGRPVLADGEFEVINPATGEAFARCQRGTPVHVGQAVAAARAAFPGWSSLADDARRAKVHALGDLLQANMAELQVLVTQESGKPLVGLNGVGAGMEVAGAAIWAHATADLTLPVEVIQDDLDEKITVHRRPLGVVGSITPWNWPLILAIWHIAPALRAGNTVVMKSSEFTPVATSRVAQLACEVLPPGVLNLVSGMGEVGAAISEHPGIDKVVFTGSTATGRHIMRAAAASLKRLTLELGGNDAGVVLPDVDVKAVAPRILGACFHNNGQTCAALKRLYVHQDIHDSMCGELAELASRLVVGNGMEEATQLGPVQNVNQLRIVAALADEARASGGNFICGGRPRGGPGYFFPPTIVTGLRDGARLVDEEQFGPIVPVISYTDIDDVMDRANANASGLGGSIWSKDIEAALRLATRLRCGTAWVNEHATIRPDVPFGGVKQSGFGVNNGRLGLEEFSSVQVVRVNRRG